MAGWSPTLLVYQSGVAWRQGYLPRSQDTWSVFLIFHTGYNHAMQRMPPDQHWLTSPPISLPGLSGLEHHHSVQEHIRGWTCCPIEPAVAQINAIRADVAHDEHFAQMKGHAYRPRRDRKRIGDHLVLFKEDYAPIFHRCLRAGFTILFDTNGSPRFVHAQPKMLGDWGFNAAALQAAERSMEWPDRELLDFLTYGGYDYSANTPPV